VYLLENGHLLRSCFVKNAQTTGGGEGGRIEEYDWDDNLVWEFDYSTDQYISHHDIEPLSNGNILVLAVEKKSYNEVIAAGFNPDMLHTEVQQNGCLLPDYVIEVEPTGSSGGNVIWEWHVWDHLIQDYDSSKDNYGDVSAHPELIDVHGGDGNIRPFWNHMNSIDYNEEFDQIILSVRGNDEIWVIDHSTTTQEAGGHSGGNSGKGGDLLYRWGNPLAYDAGSANDQMLFEQHDAQWIETGCPGEGNILVFNNGNNRPGGSYSSVDEIVPPVDSDGNYDYTLGSAYLPEDPVWIYNAENPSDFFSEAISGAQRLPNGNTLICDGVHGTLFEVTSDKEIVWLYVNPVLNTGPMTQGDEIPLDHRGHQYNAVFKIQRYATDYPGLVGRDLTPGDPIELYDSDNQAPNKPNRPDGTISGKAGTEYTYTTSAIDLDGDQVYYWFDWDDGSNSGWVGPYNSGIMGSASHVWDNEGSYDIRVKAKDIHGLESDWSESLSISMPKSKTINLFLDEHPYILPVAAGSITILIFLTILWMILHN
jgi:hypothetical protein